MYSKLPELLELSNDIFCSFDKEGKLIKANRAFTVELGYSQDTLQHITLDDLFSHPADKERNTVMREKALAGEVIKDFESRVRARDGRYLNCTWSAGYDAQEKKFHVLGICKKDEAGGGIQRDVSEKIHHVIQSFNEGFVLINNTWHISSFNPAFLAITGMKAGGVLGEDLRKLHNLEINDELISTIEKVFTNGTSAQIQYHDKVLKSWLRINIFPYNNEIILFIRNITNSKIPQLILALEKKVLELNANPFYSISDTADALLNGVEEIFPDMICSILEVDDIQEHIYHLSAPRLPVSYVTAINGTKIGPAAGSCGTAAYYRRQIIVSNIENDPLWVNFRDLILPFGFKACWSTPVISSRDTRVLATFAVYYVNNRDPSAEELKIIGRMVNILRLIIEFKKSIEHISIQNARLQEIASISSHVLRRPVATILGLVNLFDRENPDNPLNKEVIVHLEATTRELDDVIHTIVKKTMSI